MSFYTGKKEKKSVVELIEFGLFMPRSRVHLSLNLLGIRHYETHLGSHNSRAKGVLERRPVMI